MQKEIDYIALGSRVKETRERIGITQEQLGGSCDISTAHIGHIERGTRIPSLEVLFKISKALHVSLDYLIFDSVEADENIFTNITTMIRNKDKRKVNNFLVTVKALAEKIDDL